MSASRNAPSKTETMSASFLSPLPSFIGIAFPKYAGRFAMLNYRAKMSYGITEFPHDIGYNFYVRKTRNMYWRHSIWNIRVCKKES